MTLYKNARWNRWQQDMVAMRGHAARLRLEQDGTFFLTRDRTTGSHIEVHGRRILNFSSYDYLGLAQHPAVVAAAQEALGRYGTSASASRMVCGQTTAHEALDARIAGFLGTEAAMTFNSGFGTNASTIGFLFEPRDLVLHDAYMHQSALEGIRLSGAKRMSFPHNDVAALDALLAEHGRRHRRVLVLVEGAYSMDGDTCPLADVVALKQRHDFFLMVDEAHSLGTLGATGRGIGEHAGVARGDVDLWMGTLSKTLASCGGYIAGNAGLVEFLRYNCPGFVFSAALPPAGAAAADAALAVLEREPQRAPALQALVRDAGRLARQMGFDTGSADLAPILPIILRDLDLTLHTSFALYQAGICAHSLQYPAVPKHQARLRLFVTALHRPDDLRDALHAIADIVDGVRDPREAAVDVQAEVEA